MKKKWVYDSGKIYKDGDLVTEVQSSDGVHEAMWALLKDCNQQAQELERLRAENKSLKAKLRETDAASAE